MKYHNTTRGPAPCEAQTRTCPLKGNHYDTEHEALVAYEKTLKETYKEIPVASNSRVKVNVVGLKNNSYLGAPIPATAVTKFQKEFEDAVGTEKYSEMVNNRHERDGGSHYHMTVLTPKEKRKIQSPTDLPVNPEVKLVGLGTISSGDNTAWFVVCESPEIDAWRATYGLPPKDFHITLGFDPKDVYDKFKGKNTLI